MRRLRKQVLSLVDGSCLAMMDQKARPGLAPTLSTCLVTVDDGQVYIDAIAGPA